MNERTEEKKKDANTVLEPTPKAGVDGVAQEIVKESSLGGSSGKESKIVGSLDALVNALYRIKLMSFIIDALPGELLGERPVNPEFEFEIVESFAFFQQKATFKMTSLSELYLRPLPLYDFKDLYDLLLQRLSLLRSLENQHYVLMKEPSKISIGDRSIPDPSSLGIPWEEYALLNSNYLNEVSIAVRYQTHKMDQRFMGMRNGAVFTPFWHTVFSPIDVQAYFDTADTQTEDILEILTIFHDNAKEIYKISSRRSGELLSTLYTPIRLSDYLDWFPWNYALRLEAIAKYSAPSVLLEPREITKMAKSIGYRSNVASFLNGVISATYDEQVGKDATTLVLCFSALGYFQLDIDVSILTDRTDEDVLMCMLSKLMFPYNETRPESCISKETQKTVDRIIADFIMSKIRTAIPLAYNQNYPLDSVQLNVNAVDLVRMIATTPAGEGWLTVQRNVFQPPAGGKYFQGLETPPCIMQLPINEADYDERKSTIMQNWNVLQGLKRICQTAGKGYQDWPSYLDEVASSYLDFCFRMNEYNRRCYYNFFRFTEPALEQHFRNRQTDYKQLKAEFKIKSLAFLAKSLSRKRITKTKRDFSMLMASRAAEREIERLGYFLARISVEIQGFGLRDELTKSAQLELVMKILDTDVKVLKPFISYLMTSRIANDIDMRRLKFINLTNTTEHKALTKSSEMMAKYEEEMGLAREFYVNYRAHGPTATQLQDNARNGTYWTERNSYDFRNLYEIDFVQVKHLSLRLELHTVIASEVLRGKNVKVKVPICFDVITGNKTEGKKVLIENVNIDPHSPKVGEIIRVNRGEFRIVYIDEPNERALDTFTKNSSYFSWNSVMPRDFILSVKNLDLMLRSADCVFLTRAVVIRQIANHAS